MPIPEADPDEPVETKPFKFVTGKSTSRPMAIEKAPANSRAAGMYILSFRGEYGPPFFDGC